MRKILIIILLILNVSLSAQFSKQDTLRGTITPERAWWDVVHYNITVEPDFNTRTIKGNNIITCRATADGKTMQLDMQQPMEITGLLCDQRQLKLRREGNVYHVEFPSQVKKGTLLKLTVSFSGKPREAVNPPWDGGWIWKKDRYGNPWMSAACQVLGASVWYPCKDHQSDEPDSALLSIIVPDTLIGVGNGRLRSQVKEQNKTQYTWAVTNPINSYNIIPSIGKYVNWTGTFEGEKGRLDLSYWVLKENEEKAKRQFQQVPPMLKCFEHWFGPYPFYEDGYKLVESPHLGMEHQSGIAYGNKFENGYLGKDLSGTGWGKKWDFIIIHESGHEWFANNITTKDVADMWVHEGFTNYSETLFTQCEYGKEAGDEYCRGLRKNIQNDVPLIGKYGVNKEGSVDMYYKGANLVHTIRQIINDDEKFRSILRGLNKDFYHQTVTSTQVENYITRLSGTDLSKVFDQYLRTTKIPVFEFKYSNNKLSYRWGNCIEGFNMPVRITTDKEIWLSPTPEWKETTLDGGVFQLDPNFYVNSSKM
jgi:aminopeptidase N